MTMDASMIAAMTVAVSALIVAVGGQIVNIIAAWRNSSKLDQAIDVSHKISSVVDTVEKNTNSKLSKQDVQIELLLSRVEMLTSQLAKEDKDRAVLAADTRTQVATQQNLEPQRIVQP